MRTTSLLMTLTLLTGCAGFSTKDAPSQTMTTADLSPDVRIELQNTIASAVEKQEWQGLSISVANRDNLLYQHAQGWASMSEDRPMTPQTTTMVGSISKLFTVTAIMKLAEEGRVDLDAPITDYIPELSDIRRTRIDLRTPKVRHLLYHHAGYQSDLLHNFMFSDTPPDQWEREFAKLPTRVKDFYQVQQPDTAMAYSNLSFSLLGVVVERASGQSFDTYTEQALFAPLGMTGATFVPTKTQIANMAYGLDRKDETPYVFIRDLPAGSMIASSEELTHYGQMLLQQGTYNNRRFLKPETIDAMFRQQNTKSPLDGDFSIGYGFWLGGTDKLPNGIRLASHGGDIPPYHGFFMVFPDHDLTLSVLVNSVSSSMSLGELAQEIALLILNDQGKLPAANDNLATATVPSQAGADANGLYAMPFGYADLEFREKQGDYKVKTPLVTLYGTYEGDGSWSLQFRLFGLWNLTPAAFDSMRVRFGEVNNEPTAWLYSSGINLGMMTQVDTPAVAPYWLDRTGTYTVTNDDNAMYPKLKVDWDDDRQVLLAGPYLGLGMGMLIPSAPLDEQRLQLQGYGRNLGDVIEWVDADTLRYSGLEYSR